MLVYISIDNFFYQSWKLKNWIAKNWFFVKLILFCQSVMLMYNFFHCVCTFCESHLGKILGNNKETKHTLTKWNPFTCVHVYQLSSKYIKYNPQTATHIFILTLILLPCLAIFLKWWPLIKILCLKCYYKCCFWIYIHSDFIK